MRAMQGRRTLHHADWRNLSCVRTEQVEELRMRSEAASCLEEASSTRSTLTASESFAATIGHWVLCLIVLEAVPHHAQQPRSFRAG